MTKLIALLALVVAPFAQSTDFATVDSEAKYLLTRLRPSETIVLAIDVGEKNAEALGSSDVHIELSLRRVLRPGYVLYRYNTEDKQRYIAQAAFANSTKTFAQLKDESDANDLIETRSLTGLMRKWVENSAERDQAKKESTDVTRSAIRFVNENKLSGKNREANIAILTDFARNRVVQLETKSARLDKLILERKKLIVEDTETETLLAVEPFFAPAQNLAHASQIQFLSLDSATILEKIATQFDNYYFCDLVVRIVSRSNGAREVLAGEFISLPAIEYQPRSGVQRILEAYSAPSPNFALDPNLRFGLFAADEQKGEATKEKYRLAIVKTDKSPRD